MYQLLKQEGRARRGEFTTVHGTVQTPAFMNVATSAAIKGGISSLDLVKELPNGVYCSCLEEVTARLEELEQNYERLRKRLDQKDLRIHELTDILQAERTKREIELREAGSIAEAALRLNGVFEAAQKAADQYLYNIRFPNKEKSTGDSKNEPGGIQEDTGERYEGKEER